MSSKLQAPDQIYQWLLTHINHRGAYRCLSLMENVFRRELYVESCYGVCIRANYNDETWRFAYKGYPTSRVADTVNSLPEGTCFIDIGANIGLFSLLAAKKLGPNGKVFSFEPNQTVFRDLVANVEFNSFVCPVNVMNQGVAEITSTAHLHMSPGHTGAAFAVFEESNPEFSSDLPAHFVSLEACGFVRELIGDRRISVKIDVEGGELIALKSVFSAIPNDQIDLLIIEVDDINLARFGHSRDELYGFVKNHGFVPTFDSKDVHFDEVFRNVQAV